MPELLLPPLNHNTSALETTQDKIILSRDSQLPYIKHRIHTIKVRRLCPFSALGRCFMCSEGKRHQCFFFWLYLLARRWVGKPKSPSSVTASIKSDGEDWMTTQSWSQVDCNLINPSEKLWAGVSQQETCPMLLSRSASHTSWKKLQIAFYVTRAREAGTQQCLLALWSPGTKTLQSPEREKAIKAAVEACQ